MNFKKLGLIFLFISPMACKAGQSAESLLLAQSLLTPASTSQKTGTQIASPDSESDLVDGIILKFHGWPDDKEKTSIENHLKKLGLESAEQLKRLNTWIFSWSKPDKLLKAKAACHSLSGFQSLKLCEPKYAVTTP